MSGTPPACPHHEACGGCPWMTEPLEAQRARKQAWVERLLDRPVDTVVPSPRSLGYRARISLNSDRDGRLGYHRPRSHDHVPVPDCAIARPELSGLISKLPPLPGVDRVELRSDGERVVLHGTARRRPQLPELDLDTLGLSGVALGGKPVQGDATLELEVAGIHHRLRPQSFFQVNLEVNAVLVEAVRQRVLDCGGSQVLDLFAGAGNLSMPLAAEGLGLTLIESSTAAAADARRTAKRHGLQVDVRTGNAFEFQAGDAFFDVALLDPPRVGCKGRVAQVAMTRPRRILVVSCNPHALPGDIAPALSQGYHLAEVVLFDMFPHTPHAEVLAVLDR